MGADFEPIRCADDVDAQWLTAVLHAAGVGLGHRVEAVISRSIGTGQVGDNVRFELTWSGNDPALPVSVIGKFPSWSEVSRATAVNLGTYVREVGFYRDLQHAVSMRTPHIHHVGWNPDTHDFVIVMEDLRDAEQGDQLAGCSVAEAELVIDEAVGLHAATWSGTDDLRALDWLGFPDDERTRLMAAMMEWALPQFAERYAERLGPDVFEVGAALVEGYVAWSELTEGWARHHDGWCVIHGDYRLDNMLFASTDSASPVTIVDWQTVTVGTGPADIAYFCGAGLLPEARAEHERALVGRYAAGMREAGVDLSDEVAWEGYVLGSAGGYLMALIASQIVERTDRGDEMFAVMAERHAAQIRHVGLLERL